MATQMDTCTAMAAGCACSLPAGHEEPHHCTDVGPFDICNGKWRGTLEEPDFEIVYLPLSGE